jgi:hypothetical protein
MTNIGNAIFLEAEILRRMKTCLNLSVAIHKLETMADGYSAERSRDLYEGKHQYIL